MTVFHTKTLKASQRGVLAGCRVYSATSMGLLEGEFLLSWFLTTALLSKPETKVSSVYTWTGDTAIGLDISRLSVNTPVFCETE